MDTHSDKLRDKLGRTLTGSIINAVAALLMIGAITFGATVIRPMTADRDATTASATDDGAPAGNAGEPKDEPKDEPKGDANGSEANDDADKFKDVDENYPTWKPSNEEEPKEEPKEETKEEPKDEPKGYPKPDPAPSGPMTLQANFNADKGKIVVKWTAFGGDFEKYKLVRSSDSHVTWPEGEGDTLVGAVGPDGNYFIDYDAPCNTEVYYAVFAVRHGEEGYVVLGSSNVDGALRACSNEPPAEPKAMGFELMQHDGGVKLAWEQCSSEAFVAYKVVRSATNADPKYPLNDGTELIGVVGDPGATMFFDSSVEPGQTWTYRVLSMGQNGDGWYVLGLTAALSISVE
ncbi:MAG: hypothetical protein WED86_04155 [Chloroflexota bacterium]